MTNALLRRVIAPIGVLAVLLSALAATSSAQAAADTTGPTLTVDAVSSYAVGQETGDSSFYEPWGDFFPDPAAHRTYKWTARDDSGICRYTVDEEHGVEGWNEEGGEINVTTTHSSSGQYTFTVDGYYNSDDLSQIRINAYDCAGNVTSVLRPGDWVAIERDYGPTIPAGWGRTSCTCAIADSMLRTSTRNASLSTVVNAGGTNLHVALVMAKGPARGKAAIYYDGRYVTTVDTYASVNTNRVVMWGKSLNGTRNHTIKVVNLATSGRPRIDIDAYIS